MNIALPSGIWLRLTWRRVASRRVRRALIISAAFGVLIYLGTLSGRNLWFGAAGGLQLSMSGIQTSTRPSLSAEALRVLDPVARFPQTRTGHLLFSTYNSDTCRRVLFDNRTGALTEAGQISCNQTSQSSNDQLGQERAQTLLKSFRK